MTAWRLAAGLIGFACAYVACCLYDDEERGLQSILDNWWVSLDDAGRRAARVHGAFLQSFATRVLILIDRSFGAHLFSWRALLVSAGLTLSWEGLAFNPGFVRLNESFYSMAYCGPAWLLWVFTALGTATLVSTFGFALATRRRPQIVALVGSLAGIAASIGAAAWIYDARVFFVLTLATTCSIATDFVFLGVVRRVLQRVKALKSVVILVGLVACVGLAVLFTAGPAVAAAALSFRFGYRDGLFRPPDSAGFLGALATGNLHQQMIILAFLFLGLSLLVDRLLWAVISRLAYRAVLQHKSLLWTGATAFLGFAGIGSPVPLIDTIIVNVRGTSVADDLRIGHVERSGASVDVFVTRPTPQLERAWRASRNAPGSDSVTLPEPPAAVLGSAFEIAMSFDSTGRPTGSSRTEVASAVEEYEKAVRDSLYGIHIAPFRNGQGPRVPVRLRFVFSFPAEAGISGCPAARASGGQ